MLKKPQRLNKTRELQKVYRLGKTAHTSALVIKFVAGAKTRAGFVVSKKVSKKAVERNRIKRALREELRINLQQLPIGEYMVVVKAFATTLKNSQLRQDLNSALEKFQAKIQPKIQPKATLR